MSLHSCMRLGIACARDRAQTICASSLVRVSAQREFKALPPTLALNWWCLRFLV
jgi:hypothetical protein